LDSDSVVHVPGRNRLLDLLPEAELARLLPQMERVSCKLGDVVFERKEPIRIVDFPIGAVISLVIVMEDGAVVEAGTVGNEGMSGVPFVLRTQISLSRAFYQLPGESLRMSARTFQEEMGRRGAFYDIMHRHAQVYVTQVSQSAACNRVHPVEQRLCRWILMSQDRVGSDKLALTQEILAQMLGVRRASVSVVAGMLQKAGFISYTRGLITILDRAGLEASACECYGVVRAETARLLSRNGVARQMP
jgi:CRP-like cAMP-binding protein